MSDRVKNRNRICKRCNNPFWIKENGAKLLYCSSFCAREYNIRKHIELRKTNIVHKKKQRNRHYFKEYKITEDEKNIILKSQNDKCPICETSPGNPKNWHLDHCHKTGKIRGILCSRCNQGLGLFKDNVESLRKAIEYLNGN